MLETEKVSKIADFILPSRRAVAFTGAGISTESGIPDFRSPGGVWAKYQPVYFQDFVKSQEARHRYWQQKCEGHADFANASPNQGHQILAKWERQGRLRGVITQNIDGMHQLSGSRKVLELHGTARQVACLSCSYRVDSDEPVREFLSTNRVPDCPSCGGLLKHATISFGQNLSTQVIDEAVTWSGAADVFLALGSSLVVTPAADLPRMAKECGAKLVIINREPTPLDAIADVALHGALGELLGQVDGLLQPST